MPELEWLFEQNDYDYKGNLDALSERCEHVVFWTGWKKEAYDMLGELISEGKAHRKPTPLFTYLIDGKTLLLPQVKRNTAVQNRPLAAGGILQGAGAAAGVIGTFKEEYVYLRKSYGRSLFVQ